MRTSTVSECEFWAAEVRRLAGLKDEELLLGPEIAARVVGPHNVLLSECDVGARLEGRRIVVPESHPDLSFAFCHELAELILLTRARFRGPHEIKERIANRIAAAILAPPKMVRLAHSRFGERLSLIARVFGLTKTSVHLRLREVLGDEGAIVTKTGNVLVRNPAAVDWSRPDIVSAPHRTGPIRGLKSTRLRGGIDDGRVALRKA